MSSIVKQSSLGLVSNYIGIVLGFINVMIIMPAILQAEQIGLINLIIAVVLLVCPIMDLSGIQILRRYFTHVENRSELFNFTFLITLVGALIFGIIFYFGKPIFIHYYESNSPEVIPYYWWIYFISIAMCWLGIVETYAVIHGKYHVSSFVKEIVLRLGFFVFLGGMALHLYGFETYIHLHFMMYAMLAFIIFMYLKLNGLLQFSPKLPSFSKKQKYNIAKFGTFTLLTGLASVLATRIDMIMLGSMEGLKDVGIYTIAMFMATTIEVPRRTVVQSSAPIIRMFVKENEIDKVAQIHYKTIINLLLIGGFLLTLLVVNLESLYEIIPNGEIYKNGFWVVFFIGLSKIVEMMAGSTDEVILASKYYIFNILFIVLLTVFSVGFNYLLIPKWGLLGAGVATLIASSLTVWVKTILFRILFKRNVYDFKMVWIILFFLLIGGVLFRIPIFFHPILSVILKGGICCLCMFFFMKWTRYSPDLNQLINSILTRLKVDRWIQL